MNRFIIATVFFLASAYLYGEANIRNIAPETEHIMNNVIGVRLSEEDIKQFEGSLELILETHPVKIFPGDPVYMRVSIKNSGTVTVKQCPEMLEVDLNRIEFYIIEKTLSGTRYIKLPLLLSSKQLSGGVLPFGDWNVPYEKCELEPGEKTVVCNVKFFVPLSASVSDNATSWKNFLNNIPAEGKALKLVAFTEWTNSNIVEIIIKTRIKNEMQYLEKVFRESRNEEVKEADVNWNNNNLDIAMLLNGKIHYLHDHYIALPLWVEYSSHSRHWKQIEAKLSSGSLKDEIKLRRIFTEYCETEDKTCLNELKDWLHEMSAPQKEIFLCELRGFYTRLRIPEIVLIERAKALYDEVQEFDNTLELKIFKKYYDNEMKD